ncbi:universal stress protein [Halorubellus sp. PRR65]|uniref:universal stress protein n=1 Tax=Halorubellus sp. PRR65 TaxID=3098148 RepID=UPI002B260D09|nr:universal stress protein [Halorubellus sp. PRR65]
MSTVLVAVDGSEHGRHAADRAIDEADGRDATLHCLCVVDRRVHPEPGLSTGELSTIEAEDRGHDFVDAVADEARARDIPVETAVKHGVPADLVLTYAADVDADVVFVGEHGDHDHHLGGVGRRVADAADCEVVVATDAVDSAV